MQGFEQSFGKGFGQGFDQVLGRALSRVLDWLSGRFCSFYAKYQISNLNGI